MNCLHRSICPFFISEASPPLREPKMYYARRHGHILDFAKVYIFSETTKFFPKKSSNPKQATAAGGLEKCFSYETKVLYPSWKLMYLSWEHVYPSWKHVYPSWEHKIHREENTFFLVIEHLSKGRKKWRLSRVATED